MNTDSNIIMTDIDEQIKKLGRTAKSCFKRKH